MNYLYYVLALAGGIGLSCQAAINSRLSFGLGTQPLMAAFLSFTVGALCLLAITLFQGNWNALADNVGHQPWWRWLGGILGAIFVSASIFLAPKLGIANTAFLFITGQLISGMLIDNFGLFQMEGRPLDWWKYLGMGIMLTGLSLFIFGDRLFKSTQTY